MIHAAAARTIKRLTRTLVVMAAVLLPIATQGAGAVPAHAASGPVLASPGGSHVVPLATCNGSSCTGLEPNGTTCANDATTARSKSGDGATIQLRYSPSCRAVWAKEVNGLVGDQMCVSNSNGATECATINSGSDNHTHMVNDKNITAAACMFLIITNDTFCTSPPF